MQEPASKKEYKKSLEIAEEIASSNQNVLRRLYRENYRKFERYVLNNKGSEEAAKDVYQEAFMTVWIHIRDKRFIPDQEEDIQRYLLKIGRNKWIDVLRKTRFKAPADVKEIPDDEDFDPVQKSETLTTKERKIGRVMDAYKLLKEECRELLKKFYFEKQSMKEMALYFNIDAASVRNKKYRCMNELKKLAKVESE